MQLRAVPLKARLGGSRVDPVNCCGTRPSLTGRSNWLEVDVKLEPTRFARVDESSASKRAIGGAGV